MLRQNGALRLDPPTPAAVTPLYLTEVSAGVFDWSATPSGTLAVLEETGTAGVYEVTTSPGGGRKARLAMLGGKGLAY